MWEKILNNCDYVPVIYSKNFIDYQNCYYDQTDTSKILYENNKPIGVFPGLVGNCVYPPLFINGVTERVQKKVIYEIIEMFPDEIFMDLFVNKLGISLWHRILLDLNYISQIKYNLYIDLRLDIWKFIRTSYQMLIKKYKNNFQISIHNNMGLFQLVHVLVTGTETRKKETWKKQQEAIDQLEAFSLRIDLDELLGIGMGFFNYTRDECLYSVGVYDRFYTETQKIPLGHLLLWKAILLAQKMQMKYFNLGEYLINGTDKEKSISHFKMGFCTHIFPKYELKRGENVEKV